MAKVTLNHNINNLKCLVRVSHLTHKPEDHDKLNVVYYNTSSTRPYSKHVVASNQISCFRISSSFFIGTLVYCL